ncbi:hypothetical protein CBR_g10769 [Chara braunii]|uniref:Uncharacterized protein n=1 Tax=Chara braunii TaxID=69332 RepID=A0A388KP48_CHABU|nr:hypothetical protein CBR_g10769 [Chara braunii]|eukprot:GBG71829.1 hypothetical protein CBR_g10769 [Chara braunii]
MASSRRNTAREDDDGVEMAKVITRALAVLEPIHSVLPLRFSELVSRIAAEAGCCPWMVVGPIISVAGLMMGCRTYTLLSDNTWFEKPIFWSVVLAFSEMNKSSAHQRILDALNRVESRIQEIVSAKTTPQNTATMVDKDGNPLNEKKLDFNLTGLFRRIWLIHHDVENHGVARKHQYWIEDRALENFILDLADWNVAAAMTLPNEKGPTLFRNYSQLSRFDEDDDQDFAKAAAEEEAAVEKEAVAEEEAAIAEEAAVEEEAATEKEANEEQFEATDMHNPTSKKVSTRTQVANDEDEDIAEVRLFRRRRSLEKQVGTHVESVADRRESQEERSAENEFEPDDHELQDKNVADAEDVQQSQREGSTQNELDADVNEDTNIADAQHPQGEASQVNNGDEVIVEDLRSQSGSPSAEKNDILRHRRTSKGSQATTSQHKQT